MPSGAVQKRDWCRFVCELQRGELFGYSWCKLFRRVRELCARRVFKHSGREIVGRVRVMSGRHVLERDRRERVHCMPGELHFRVRIRFNHKLRL